MKIGLVYRNRGIGFARAARVRLEGICGRYGKGGYAKMKVVCYDPNTRTRGLCRDGWSKVTALAVQTGETTGTFPLDSIMNPPIAIKRTRNFGGAWIPSCC